MKVTRSGYYAYRKRRVLDKRCGAVTAQKREVRACFYEHRRRYGSRRIAKQLKIGRFRVRSIMKQQNLRAIAPKSFVPRTTDWRHGGRISPNLLKDLKNERLSAGEAVVGDITYLPLRNGKWCYLATFQDKLTRRIIGWEVSAAMTAELVVKALRMALRNGLIRPNAIIHTDRGSQYVSDVYRELLQIHGLRQSMSAAGNCYDNAQAESFFSRFKAELVEGGVFESVEQARTETFSYIEGYYNRIRLHSSLGYLSPMEFEKQLKIKTKRSRESFVSI
jgi:transposase InsO family protein